MPDLLGFASRRGYAGGTIALHEREGMPDAGHRVGIILTSGTASHAFGSFKAHRSAGYLAFVKIRELDVDDRIELGDERLLFVSVAAPADSEPRDDDLMLRIAEEAAAVRAAAPVELPEVPELGEDLVDNVRRLFNLTNADVASLFGISERHVHRWKTIGVPADRENDLAALQAIGLTVVGGVGPAGARAWLRAGAPSGEDLVRAGRFAELASRAEAEQDSPFT